LILNPLIDVSFRSAFAQCVAFLLRRRYPKYRDSLFISAFAHKRIYFELSDSPAWMYLEVISGHITDQYLDHTRT
jgi:hypothetical protein